MAEGSKENRIRKKVIRENQLDFLEDLRAKGIPLNNEQKNLLRKHRNKEELPRASKKGTQVKPGVDNSVKSLEQIEADKYIDIVEEGDELSKDELLILDHEAYDKFATSSVFKYQGGKNSARCFEMDFWKTRKCS